MALQDYFNRAIKVLHSGSRVICDPPVMNTDDDYLLLILRGEQDDLIYRLIMDGYEGGGSMHVPVDRRTRLELHPDYAERYSGSVYKSFKKGNINIILTCDFDYFDNFRCSTLLAKRLNLLNKEDRITLFEAINFDEWPEYENVVIK